MSESQRIKDFIDSQSLDNYDKTEGQQILDLLNGKNFEVLHLNIISKIDGLPLTTQSFDLAENAESIQNFTLAFLKKACNSYSEIFNEVVIFLKREKEGAIGRHILIIHFLSQINYKENQNDFASASVLLLQILEYVFSEIYQITGNDNTILGPEEKQLMISKGIPKLKQCTLNFIKNNHQIMNSQVPAIDISSLASLDDNFKNFEIAKPPLEDLNKACFLRFIGNLIAKVDFAKYYASHQGQDMITKILSDLEVLLKPFQEKVLVNAMEILESEVKTNLYKKYRHLAMEGMPSGLSLVNLHAALLLNPEKDFTESWIGYGSNFCVFILRTVIVDKLYRVYSPIKLLQVVTAIFSNLPQDYLGGIEYYQVIFTFLLQRLKSANFTITNTNSHNAQLADFLLTLHAVDVQASKCASDSVRDLTIYLLELMDLKTKYLVMLKLLDLSQDSRFFCQGRGFSQGFVTVLQKEVNAALNRDPQQPELFLRDSILGRLFHIIMHADHKMLGNIRESKLQSLSRYSDYRANH